jgi:hypothetical protein
MKKPIVEKIEKDLETVEDIIEALKRVPKDYTLHPLGQKCAIVVDHYFGCVYMDDPLTLDLDELIENAHNSAAGSADIDADGKVNIDENMLRTYQECHENIENMNMDRMQIENKFLQKKRGR